MLMKTAADLWCSPHLSAFLIAAIKVRPHFHSLPLRLPRSPADTGKSCLRPPLYILVAARAVAGGRGWLKGRIDSASAENLDRRRRNSDDDYDDGDDEGGRREGGLGSTLFWDISDSRTKKEIDSPRRKRELLSARPSYYPRRPLSFPSPQPGPCPPVASLISRGLFRIDRVLPLFFSLSFSPSFSISISSSSFSFSSFDISAISASDDNCTNSLRTCRAIRLELRDIFTAFFDCVVYDF